MTRAPARYRRSPGALSRRIADSIVVTAAGTTGWYTLESSSAAVWDQLAAPVSLDEIVRRVASLYGIDADDIREQVEGTVVEFHRAGLVLETRDRDG